MHEEPLAKDYLDEVDAIYRKHGPKVLRGWKGLRDHHIPFLELTLERIATNAITPSKGSLAIHKDRRMALPGLLTKSTLEEEYKSGDLVLIDEFLIVDYRCTNLLMTPRAPQNTTQSEIQTVCPLALALGALRGVVGGSWAGACALGGSREGCERTAFGGRAVAPKVRP